nr:hypothetical protein [Tanacetum cinerariifolium]
DALDSLIEGQSDDETPEDTRTTIVEGTISVNIDTAHHASTTLTGPLSQAASRRQRAQERFARVFGSIEDVQQDDYESPL